MASSEPSGKSGVGKYIKMLFFNEKLNALAVYNEDHRCQNPSELQKFDMALWQSKMFYADSSLI